MFVLRPKLNITALVVWFGFPFMEIFAVQMNRKFVYDATVYTSFVFEKPNY